MDNTANITNKIKLTTVHISMFLLGLSLMFLNDLYNNYFVVHQGNNWEPMSDVFISLLPLFGCVGVFLFPYNAFIRRLFSTSFKNNELSTLRQATKADKALFSGLLFLLLSASLYVAFYALIDSPVRIFLK
jgi:hypothetical protein